MSQKKKSSKILDDSSLFLYSITLIYFGIFDDTHSAGPLSTECKGNCGCARANGFEPDTPEGGALIKAIEH
ncbi:MAG: hypothetical protein AAF705_19540 [Bacteroidota bacterium]